MIHVNWDEMGLEALENIAREYGTPFYLYDADSVRARVDALREAKPEPGIASRAARNGGRS